MLLALWGLARKAAPILLWGIALAVLFSAQCFRIHGPDFYGGWCIVWIGVACWAWLRNGRWVLWSGLVLCALHQWRPVLVYENHAGIFFAALAILSMRHKYWWMFVAFMVPVLDSGCKAAVAGLAIGASLRVMWMYRRGWLYWAPSLFIILMLLCMAFWDRIVFECVDGVTRRVWQIPPAWEMIKLNPWLGTGPNAFRIWISQFECAPALARLDGYGVLHCDYVDSMVNFGVVGSALLMGGIASILGRRKHVTAWLAMGLIMAHAVVDLPMHSPWIVALLAVLLTGENKDEYEYHKGAC